MKTNYFYLLLLLVIGAFNFLLNTTKAFFNIKQKWVYFSYYISFLFFLCIYILQSLRNYIYFYLSVLLTYITTLFFFILFGDLGNNILYNFLVWFLLTISAFTFVGLTQSLYHLHNNNNNEPEQGPKGESGELGLTGRKANTSISDYDLCVQQMNESTNKNILKKLNRPTEDKNYFNNLYLKQNFERICGYYFKN